MNASPLTRAEKDRAFAAARNAAAYHAKPGANTLRNETQARAAAFRALRIAQATPKRGLSREAAMAAVRMRADQVIAYRAAYGWEA